MSDSYTVNPTKPYLGASANYGAAQAFKEGGPVDDEASESGTSQAQGAIPTDIGDEADQGQGAGDISSALGVIKKAIVFRRQQFGLGGQQQADNQYAPRGPTQSQSEQNDNSAESWGGSSVAGRAPLQINGAPKFDPRAFMKKQKTSALDTGEQDTQSFASGGPVDDQNEGFNYSQPDQADAPASQAIPEQPQQQDAGAGLVSNLTSDGEGKRAAFDLQSGSNPQRLVGYVKGVDGDPQLADAMAKKVDPQGQMDADTRNIKAVAAASTPEDQAKVVASNIQAFNAKTAFARAALNGSQSKSADINASTVAATQAYTHMLDGKSAVFQPSQNGVTVTVKDLAGKDPPEATELTQPQYNDLLNMGKHGQYDNMYEHGIKPVLQIVKQQAGTAVGQPQGQPGQQQPQGQPQQQPQGQPQQQQQPQQPQGQPQQQQQLQQPQGQVSGDAQGQAPGQPQPQARPQTQAQQAPEQTPGQPPSLQQQYQEANAMALKIFPQLGAQSKDRAAYVQKIMAATAEAASKLDIAKNTRIGAAGVTAAAKVESAGIYVKGKDYAADQKLTGELARAHEQGASAQDAHLATVYAAEDKNASLLQQPLSPQGQAIADYFLKKTQGAPAAAAPAAPGRTAAPAASAPPASAAPTTMQRNGQTYYKVPGGWSSKPPQ